MENRNIDMGNGNLLLIKGDVTGIQQYVFSVKSENAAKQLKMRSYNVQKICHDLVEEIGEDPLIVGGGHFLIKATKTTDWNDNYWNNLKKKYEKRDRVNNLNIVLSKIEIPDEQSLEENYSDYIRKLEIQAGKDKLQQGRYRMTFFEPYTLATTYVNKEPESPNDIPLWGDCKENSDNIHTPKKGIIDFDSIAAFAKNRTGYDLLAALKLDVDNLGECFRNLKNRNQSEELSNALSDFFDFNSKKIRDAGSFHNGKSIHRFKDNIYLVFAGGDDTFVIGAYDAILEFAKILHAEFETFAKQLRKKIPQLTKDLTFSASITFFKPTFPVVKIAAQAEEDLSLAKNLSPQKNRISVMGEVFTWKEYDCLLEITDKLVDLVKNKGESKALIQRIRASRTGFASAVRHTNQGKLEIPRVWRLFYFVRDVDDKNKTEIEGIIKNYEELIMDAFLKRGTANPMLFPIAARLAEYKLKNHKS